MAGLLAWLARLLNAAPPEEMHGLSLQDLRWQVDGEDIHPSAFFRALPILLPEDCFLQLESGAHPPLLEEFLARESVLPVAAVARATIWPRMNVWHIPASASLLNELADLVDSHSARDLCYHLHVYDRDGVLLAWYDAFSDPFRVAERLPRERIEAFCRELNVSYEPC